MSHSRRRAGRPALLIASTVVLVFGLATVALADTFTGTSGPDTISGTDGNDTITSGRGNDNVFAGVGSDSVSLGAGADSADASLPIHPFGNNLFAECQNDDDTVSGQGGPDTLDGGVSFRCFELNAESSDHDSLNGAGGADTINVIDSPSDPFDSDGAGSDVANGGRGNDICRGDFDDVFLSCEHINP
jgi:Ca2+-binding RTX toxin-like protein